MLITDTSFFEWPFLHRLFVQAHESLRDVYRNTMLTSRVYEGGGAVRIVLYKGLMDLY